MLLALEGPVRWYADRVLWSWWQRSEFVGMAAAVTALDLHEQLDGHLPSGRDGAAKQATIKGKPA